MADEADGHWVTEDGHHIWIKGGIVEKGPAHLIGKRPTKVTKAAPFRTSKQLDFHGNEVGNLTGSQRTMFDTSKEPEGPRSLGSKNANDPKHTGLLFDGGMKAHLALAEGEVGHWVTIDGEHVFIRDSAGSVPKRLQTAAGTEKRFTKAALQRHLLEHHEAMGGGTQGVSAHEAQQFERSGRGMGQTTFHKKLPDEVKTYLEGNPNARRLFRVTSDVNEAGGLDSMHDLGEDQYFAHIDKASGNKVHAALETAHNSNDPEVRFLAHVHDNLPEGGNRGKVDALNASKLRIGDEFKVNGEKYRVAEDEHGMRVLHSDDYGHVPVDAVQHVPADKGTFKPGKASKREAIPFSADAYVLELQADGEGKAVPMALEGLPAVNDAGEPIHFRKVKIATCQDWTHRGTGDKFTITRQRADEWARNTSALAAAGVKPFVPGQHREQFNAADNFGYVERVERDGDDVYAIVALHGDDALKLAARNGRSIYVVKDAIDASGKVHPGESLHHLALVPNPALPHLGGTLKIAASADGGAARDVPVFVLAAADTPPAPKPRRHKMKAELAQQVRAKFGFGADVPDDQIDDKAAEKALALSADVDTLTTERDAKAQEVLALSAGDPGKLDPINLAAFGMNADMVWEDNIRKGAMTKSEVDQVKKILRDTNGRPTRLALSASSDNGWPLEINLARFMGSMVTSARIGTQRPSNVSVAEPLSLSADDVQKQQDDVAKQAREQAEAYKKEQLAARGIIA